MTATAIWAARRRGDEAAATATATARRRSWRLPVGRGREEVRVGGGVPPPNDFTVSAAVAPRFATAADVTTQCHRQSAGHCARRSLIVRPFDDDQFTNLISFIFIIFASDLSLVLYNINRYARRKLI